MALTMYEAAKRTGVSVDTVRNYIKAGKIQARKQKGHGNQIEYAIDEAELAKLPKPYKKRNQPAEREVPQGQNFMPLPVPALPVYRARVVEVIFEDNSRDGLSEQIARWKQLQLQPA